LRKTPFFRRKLSKIAENCDHNIDPWTWSPWQCLTVGHQKFRLDSGDEVEEEQSQKRLRVSTEHQHPAEKL
jgi:hypothetical protein